MDDAYVRSVEEVVKTFDTSLDNGLTDTQVEALRKQYGTNSLPEDPPTPLWQLILAQFKDQLVVILLVSAAVSFLLALFDDGDDFTAFVDPAVILIILVLNAVVGVQQETNAEKAIAALSEYSPAEAKVIRSGIVNRIKAENLVPGDIVDVAVGDRVPADCRVFKITSNSFRVDQALLTGESESVSKDTIAIADPRAVKQDQINMLFSGTTVTVGHCHAIVVLTGSATAIGDIHTSIVSQISEPTPLKQKLDDFGEMLAKVIMVICILVWVINIRNFNDPAHKGWLKGAIYYFKIAVALAVAAIPEGLAVVITTCLALGTRKMAQKNAIVRSLPSVETLGSTSVICSDKTGTLTTNQMSVQKAIYFSDALIELSVEGTSFAPIGHVKDPIGKVLPIPINVSPSILHLAEVCSLCNDAEIVYDGKSDTYSHVGEPTEAALRVLSAKLGFNPTKYNGDHVRSATFEFSRDRKSMSVIVSSSLSGTSELFVKGAPESVIERCTSIYSDSAKIPLNPQIVAEFNERVVAYGKQGLRVMALAIREDIGSDPLASTAKSSEDYIKLEQNMTLVGIVGMLDPPRPEVRESIQKCYDAGIRVVVITGDNKQTAETICRQIGVFGADEDISKLSYTGREFDDLSEAEKVEASKTAKLFSRAEPAHKSKLVDLLQSAGAIVAMTGDGVNDAPALKKADIGIAMGSGTDVAKLAADMVLADDNFATIETAIEEGRSIYNNTQQFIRYLISSNIGEVVSIFLTVLLGMPEALIPVQLLWVNLVTDGLPATALGFNPPDNEIMHRKPRARDEPIVGKWLFFRYMVIGTYVGCATVFGYAWWFVFNSEGPQIAFSHLSHFHSCPLSFPEIGCEMFSNEMSKRASTVSLSILVVIEMFNAMNGLSSTDSLFTLPLWKNMTLVYAIMLSMILHCAIVYIPFFRTLFSVASLSLNEWKAVFFISFPVIVIDEILKYFERTVVEARRQKEKQL
ncbi:hypothetical protein V1520DRAFT_373938 [Lipomyces starkeyi]|uniref:Calcium-transporting ATPase n=1 Tax=Lipomyces starkeyi NRRL Y-11557 TaxID=675824 RepID=A0A1E3PV23_LIPST|nr:hypothetical protein LIPSTDRAFT_59335 [Lipomyces starkeyi NRRL Y-11557]